MLTQQFFLEMFFYFELIMTVCTNSQILCSLYSSGLKAVFQAYWEPLKGEWVHSLSICIIYKMYRMGGGMEWLHMPISDQTMQSLNTTSVEDRTWIINTLFCQLLPCSHFYFKLKIPCFFIQTRVKPIFNLPDRPWTVVNIRSYPCMGLLIYVFNFPVTCIYL